MLKLHTAFGLLPGILRVSVQPTLLDEAEAVICHLDARGPKALPQGLADNPHHERKSSDDEADTAIRGHCSPARHALPSGCFWDGQPSRFTFR